ncbi:hypothetical protein [Acidocella sp.]|jgi:hypothetical protein|uniref:hypothetical protein n=1 Tax=Acidocella sp. TaxID=50710 RepID=UPI002F3EA2D4
MPSSKNPVINRQKANDYRLAHPEWHRRTNREWARKKRDRLGKSGRAAVEFARKSADPAGYLWRHARDRASSKGLPFDLTPGDISVPEFCPVLGIRLEWGRGQMGWRNMTAPSLDRVRPQLGYVRGNVRIISNRANHLKSNGTITEFEAVLIYMRREGANRDLAEQGFAEEIIAPASPQLALQV